MADIRWRQVLKTINLLIKDSFQSSAMGRPLKQCSCPFTLHNVLKGWDQLVSVDTSQQFYTKSDESNTTATKRRIPQLAII